MIYTHLLNRGPAGVRSRADRLLKAGPPSGEMDCEASQSNLAGSDLIPQAEPFTVKRFHSKARPQAKEIDCILGSVWGIRQVCLILVRRHDKGIGA